MEHRAGPRDELDADGTGQYGVPFLESPRIVTRAAYEDRYETRVANWFSPWDGQGSIDVGVVMAGLSTTSIVPTNCFAAPDAFRLSQSQFCTYSPDYDVDLTSLSVRDLGDISMPILDPLEGLDRIESALFALHQLPQQPFIILIGGDHAVTAPAFRGFCRAHPDLKMGLIHIDAHNDVRVMDHGPTNGTPVRQIIESGYNISGENVVQVGIHGFMNASHYKQWVEGQGGTITLHEQEQAEQAVDHRGHPGQIADVQLDEPGKAVLGGVFLQPDGRTDADGEGQHGHEHRDPKRAHQCLMHPKFGVD